MATAPRSEAGARPRRASLESRCLHAADWCLVGYAALLPFFHLRPWSLLATALLVVGAALAAPAAATRGARAAPRSATLALFVAYLALSALSILASDDVAASATEGYRILLKSLLVVFIVVAGGGDDARVRRLALGPAAAALALSAVALASAASGMTNRWGGVTGPQIGYNAIAMFLAATTPFVLLLSAAARRARWVWSAAAAVTVTTLLLTVSRIGWAAFAVALAVWLALVQEGRRRALLAVAVAAAAFAAVAPHLRALGQVTDTARAVAEGRGGRGPAPMKPMSWRDVATLDGRIEFAWAPAVALVRAHPLAGAGFGSATFGRRTRGAPALANEHNALLSVAVQSGLVAAAAYLALLAAVVVTLARAVRRAPPGAGLRRAATVAVLAALVAEYVLHGVAEPTNTGRMGLLLALLVGLAVVLCAPQSPGVAVAGNGAKG